MITYKHEQFIKEAILGVLSQQVSFNVEFIIADDNSPDGTENIISDIVNNHPKGSWIKYTRHATNKGMMSNFIWSLQQSIGKYIALCEGDDYWTDPFKLQKQVDFLELNPDFNLCGHHTTVLSEKGLKEPFNMTDYELDFKMIGGRNYSGIRTQTLLFRNNLIYPEWMYSVYGGDRAIIYLNALKGKLKMLSFNGAVYRLHPGGIEQKYKKDKLALPARNIKEDLEYYKLAKFKEHKRLIFRRLIINHFYILFWSLREQKFISFINYIRSIILLPKLLF